MCDDDVLLVADDNFGFDEDVDEMILASLLLLLLLLLVNLQLL